MGKGKIHGVPDMRADLDESSMAKNQSTDAMTTKRRKTEGDEGSAKPKKVDPKKIKETAPPKGFSVVVPKGGFAPAAGSRNSRDDATANWTGISCYSDSWGKKKKPIGEAVTPVLHSGARHVSEPLIPTPTGMTPANTSDSADMAPPPATKKEVPKPAAQPAPKPVATPAPPTPAVPSPKAADAAGDDEEDDEIVFTPENSVPDGDVVGVWQPAVGSTAPPAYGDAAGASRRGGRGSSTRGRGFVDRGGRGARGRGGYSQPPAQQQRGGRGARGRGAAEPVPGRSAHNPYAPVTEAPVEQKEVERSTPSDAKPSEERPDSKGAWGKSEKGGNHMKPKSGDSKPPSKPVSAKGNEQEKVAKDAAPEKKDAGKKVCNAFKESGSCKFGDKCRFAHEQ